MVYEKIVESMRRKRNREGGCLMRPAVKWCCFNVSIVVCRKHHNSPTTIGRKYELGHLDSTLWAISIHTATKTIVKDIFDYTSGKMFRYSRGLGFQYQQPTNHIIQFRPKTRQSCRVKLDIAPDVVCCNVRRVQSDARNHIQHVGGLLVLF